RQDNQETPVILMGYLNPIEKFGYQKFVKTANRVGVDGILIVDSPPEESGGLLKLLRQHNMAQIFLIAPTTTPKRQKYILSKSSGFIYCVALKGVTGAKNLEYDDLSVKIASIKELTELPVAIGFGIKDVESAQNVAEYGDAIVIGSALVQKLGKCKNQQQIEMIIKQFIKPIAQAINTREKNDKLVPKNKISQNSH
ncbi:MAG: tryptophan synthase subunit alpha, partial [Proteobacteria bacterium]|nr:tryptophan synthase subunit alpha [Pseudomonadota bacterium]